PETSVSGWVVENKQLTFFSPYRSFTQSLHSITSRNRYESDSGLMKSFSGLAFHTQPLFARSSSSSSNFAVRWSRGRRVKYVPTRGDLFESSRLWAYSVIYLVVISPYLGPLWSKRMNFARVRILLKITETS